MKKPKTKILGKNGFKYRPKFGVVVICEDERSQVAAHLRIKELGLKTKVVTI